MNTRRWLVVTVATTLAVVALAVGTNAAIDIYGLFRNPAHRSLRVYGNERVAKYLMSRGYVQANFDGVFVGSSVSANWNLGSMRSVRLYNESVNGGNIVEEKAILDQLLEHGGTGLALVLVHPYMTSEHESNGVTLAPREYWGALGSLNLLDAYKNAVKVRLGREPQLFDPAGTQDFGDGTKALNARLRAMMLGTADFEIDPVALQRFREVVAELHARRIPVGFVMPPTAEPLFAPKRAAFTKYASIVLADRSSTDRVLDFSDAEFAQLRDPDNFSDGVHLRPAGAVRLTAVIDDRIKTWIADGWLNRLPARGPETVAATRLPPRATH
jgi:hypothetical protein